MPEQRLAKTRETLPEGYQFGEGGNFFDDEEQWRRLRKHYVEPMIQALRKQEDDALIAAFGTVRGL